MPALKVTARARRPVRTVLGWASMRQSFLPGRLDGRRVSLADRCCASLPRALLESQPDGRWSTGVSVEAEAPAANDRRRSSFLLVSLLRSTPHQTDRFPRVWYAALLSPIGVCGPRADPSGSGHASARRENQA